VTRGSALSAGSRRAISATATTSSPTWTAYLLTPRGIERKAAITVHFLRRKLAEYESLKKEITQLRREVGRNRGQTTISGTVSGHRGNRGLSPISKA